MLKIFVLYQSEITTRKGCSVGRGSLMAHDIGEHSLTLRVMSFIDQLHSESLPAKTASTVENANLG